MATSSDAPRRSDIIRLAAQRAGRSLSDVVYVGDGVWDLKASGDLGIGFIGTGSRLNRLKEAGAEHMIEILEAALLLRTARAAIGPNSRLTHACASGASKPPRAQTNAPQAFP